MIEKMKMRASVILRDWHRAAGSDDDDVKELVIFRPTMMHGKQHYKSQLLIIFTTITVDRLLCVNVNVYNQNQEPWYMYVASGLFVTTAH